MHKYNIKESIRAQFIGSALMALNSENFDLESEIKRSNNTEILLRHFKEIIEQKLKDNKNKTEKINILSKILDEQDLTSLDFQHLQNILNKVNDGIIPFINENTNTGEDLLNLFFTTFNKYVQKEDKNQAFTPSHITDFMAEVIGIDENSIVLYPTCGSGSFLVQAMVKMLKNVKDPTKRDYIKQNQLHGIEIEEKAFGLASTNMLIHKDGKSNIVLDSCFNLGKEIQQMNITHILMNPPFNGKRMPKECPVQKNNGMDATKGLYFVNFVAEHIETKGALLATILPLQAAIGSGNTIKEYKKKMLEKHTLKAVFSLPNDIFHPGASASSCIMVFELNKKHNPKIATFFGYYKDDGFIKKKNMGRIEKKDWTLIKKKWLDAYKNNQEIDGFSVLENVDYNDEWLAEAYMKTDYSSLKEEDFVKTIREFLAFKIKEDIK
ncbi:HsdM family class I SAM-dependent methyltransferase [Mycoplasma sp. 246B]